MKKYKYESVYSWNVISDIKEGKAVYVLDMRLNEVEDVDSMEVCRLMTILNSEEKDRYYFYRAVEVDE